MDETWRSGSALSGTASRPAFAFILTCQPHVLVELEGKRNHASPDSKRWKDADEHRLEK
jgi:hypothetical protein